MFGWDQLIQINATNSANTSRKGSSYRPPSMGWSPARTEATPLPLCRVTSKGQKVAHTVREVGRYSKPEGLQEDAGCLVHTLISTCLEKWHLVLGITLYQGRSRLPTVWTLCHYWKYCQSWGWSRGAVSIHVGKRKGVSWLETVTCDTHWGLHLNSEENGNLDWTWAGGWIPRGFLQGNLPRFSAQGSSIVIYKAHLLLRLEDRSQFLIWRNLLLKIIHLEMCLSSLICLVPAPEWRSSVRAWHPSLMQPCLNFCLSDRLSDTHGQKYQKLPLAGLHLQYRQQLRLGQAKARK